MTDQKRLYKATARQMDESAKLRDVPRKTSMGQSPASETGSKTLDRTDDEKRRHYAAKIQDMCAEHLSVDNDGEITGVGPLSYAIAADMTALRKERDAMRDALLEACNLLDDAGFKAFAETYRRRAAFITQEDD